MCAKPVNRCAGNAKCLHGAISNPKLYVTKNSHSQLSIVQMIARKFDGLLEHIDMTDMVGHDQNQTGIQ